MKKWLGKQLGRQLSNPQGFWGIIVAKLMNYGNRPMYEATYRSLDLSPNDQVLEIGFGNGAFIKDIIQQIHPGTYAGIDISTTMVRLARHKNASLVKANKAQLIHGNISNLPFDDNSFNKVFTVNTIYFWENPLQVMEEVKKVLFPGGRFVITLATREAMSDSKYTREKFKLYEKTEVEELFLMAEFTNVYSTYKRLNFEDSLCVSGQKASKILQPLSKF